MYDSNKTRVLFTAIVSKFEGLFGYQVLCLKCRSVMLSGVVSVIQVCLVITCHV